MKNVIKISIVLFILILGYNLPAQDIEQLYEQAKSALLQGDYAKASTLVADAQQRIQLDPNLDPNGAYTKKLLPRLEQAADNMEEIAKALDALYTSTQSGLVFPDLPPSLEAVQQYTTMVKEASQQLLARRDSILASHELDPEFREAVRKVPNYSQVEQLATSGIIQQLSDKFAHIAVALTDSLKSIDKRYQDLTAQLEKMKKSATAGRAEREKLQQQLTQLSQERLNYMNTISEMLIGEPTPENQQMRAALIDNNLETVFSNVIQNETKRVQEIGEVDSSGYKELVEQYDRLQNYNQVFIKNNIVRDQSELLAKYQAAINGVKVLGPAKFKLWLWILLPFLAIVLLLVIIYVQINRKSKNTTLTPPPPAVKPTV
jgi:chromosome segregation ATPase